jgi:hypothetical protein
MKCVVFLVLSSNSKDFVDETCLRHTTPLFDSLHLSLADHIHCLNPSQRLFWDSPDATVLFVLTQLPNGKRIILLSSDVTLPGDQVIEAYGKRFKIEVCCRTFALLLGGFAYQFWLKLLDKTAQFPSNLCLADYTSDVQHQIQQKLEACERFVNLKAIALGVLQILALELPQAVWGNFPRWFRTLPNHGYPTEQIVRLTLQHQQPLIFSRSRRTLLLPQLLADKID